MADRIASDLHEEFYFLGSFLFNLSIVLNTPSVITRLVRALSGGAVYVLYEVFSDCVQYFLPVFGSETCVIQHEAANSCNPLIWVSPAESSQSCLGLPAERTSHPSAWQEG